METVPAKLLSTQSQSLFLYSKEMVVEQRTTNSESTTRACPLVHSLVPHQLSSCARSPLLTLKDDTILPYLLSPIPEGRLGQGRQRRLIGREGAGTCQGGSSQDSGRISASEDWRNGMGVVRWLMGLLGRVEGGLLSDYFLSISSTIDIAPLWHSLSSTFPLLVPPIASNPYQIPRKRIEAFTCFPSLNQTYFLELDHALQNLILDERLLLGGDAQLT